MRFIGKLILLSAALICCASEAQPVMHLIVGNAAGASSDAIARMLADPLGKALHRTIVVDNRPGASGNIAAAEVARSGGDGNEILLTYNVHPAIAVVFHDLAFDPIKDFHALGLISTTPYMLVANPALPGANLREVLALAKNQHRSLNFATPGVGTPQQLMMERLKRESGVDIHMVPYKGSGPAQTDVIAGQVDMALSSLSLAEPQAKAGNVKVLAVTSRQRLPAWPNTPTATESGYDGFITDGWYALLLSAKVPEAVVDAYNQALTTVLSSAAIREKFQAMGMQATPSKPEVLSTLMEHDAAMWKKVVADYNIKFE